MFVTTFEMTRVDLRTREVLRGMCFDRPAVLSNVGVRCSLNFCKKLVQHQSGPG